MEQESIMFSMYYNALHEDDYIQQDLMQQLFAYLSQANLDTMHFHKAMRELDRQEFINAIVDEVNNHTVHKHWKLVPQTEVPERVKMLSAVWVMKRKREMKTGKYTNGRLGCMCIEDNNNKY
eukprot:7919757-Ditylum_brightwellii.AAC.2